MTKCSFLFLWRTSVSDHSTNDKVDTIQRDLACPQCEYNLRGLQGDVVHCPECGLGVDVARLITSRWTGPWHKAPGLLIIEIPVLVVVVGFVAWAVAFVTISTFEPLGKPLDMVLIWSFAAVLVGIWIWRVLRAGRVFSVPLKGELFAVLSHLVLFLYVVGLFTPLVYVGIIIFEIGIQADVMTTITRIAILGGLLSSLLVARWIERWMAQQCIREYLKRSAGQRRLG